MINDHVLGAVAAERRTAMMAAAEESRKAKHLRVPRPRRPSIDRLVVRAAVPSDRAEVLAMHRRCSPSSIVRRWHGPRHDLPEPYLTDALAGLPTHIALVAVDGSQVVALASAVEGEHGLWDLGMLVEDAWQRCGLATELAGAIAQRVAGRGGRRIGATTLPDQARVLASLTRFGPVTMVGGSDGITAHLVLDGSGEDSTVAIPVGRIAELVS